MNVGKIIKAILFIALLIVVVPAMVLLAIIIFNWFTDLLQLGGVPVDESKLTYDELVNWFQK